jgi:predicted TIM-barrel fold metal-dependent hydrolase
MERRSVKETRIMTPFHTDYPVIDVDMHIHESPSELAPFAEGMLRQFLEIDTGPEKWLDTPGYSPLTPYDPPLGQDTQQQPHLIRDANQLRADLDARGIDAAIVFTGRLLGTAFSKDGGYAVGISRAYNRYLQERWLNPEEGIYGAIMVAAQDPVASAQEIVRYAHRPGFAAVYLPMAGVHPLWGHRQYDPIYAAAQAAGLPVVLQGYTAVYPVFPYQIEQFDTALAKQVIARPFGAMANFASIVTGGVPARFPELKIVFTECGVSWLPFMLWRLDAQYRWLREEVPFYPSPPGEYVRRQIYTTTHKLAEPGEPQALFALLESIGLQDQILFASDWPHYDADSPESVLRLSLPPDWERKVLGGNALATFKLTRFSRRRHGVYTADSTP